MPLNDVRIDSAPFASNDNVVPVHKGVKVSSASGLPVFWRGKTPVTGKAEQSASLQLGLKRALDIAAAISLLIFLFPLLVFVAVAIKISDPGPVLFRQPRMGLNGEKFGIFKFRTMRVAQCSVEGVQQTQLNDPRISPLGGFLRRTSIDELPQFINVLLGHMSMVGPRPHVAGQLAGGQPYKDVVPYYDDRLRVRPGITGWAQINGLRGSTEDTEMARARVDHDLAYIQNLSVSLDIKILFLTVKREFLTGHGN